MGNAGEIWDLGTILFAGIACRNNIIIAIPGKITMDDDICRLQTP